jgi:hypothetical protein
VKAFTWGVLLLVWGGKARAQDSTADTGQHWTWKAPAFTQAEIEKAIRDTITAITRGDRDCRDVSAKRVKEMAHYRFSADTAAMLLCGKVWVGMSDRLLGWAMPVYDARNHTATAGHQSDQWVYREGRARHLYGHPHATAVYVYVDDGVVTAVQVDE